MSLYIRHSVEGKLVETEFVLSHDWRLPKINNLNVIEIEAFGEELDRLAVLFKGLIRPPKYEKVIWEDDLARVLWAILENLAEHYEMSYGWLSEKPWKTLDEYYGHKFKRRK